MTAATKSEYDILVVIPLEEEFLQFQKIFPSTKNHTEDGCLIFEFDTGVSDLSGLVVLQEEMGKSAAGAAVDEILQRFDVKLIACVGIAGALSKDLNLCDVCYSGNILDVLDNSKASDSDGGGMNVALSPTHYKSPKQLSNAVDYVRLMPELQDGYAHWQKNCDENAGKLIPEPVPGRDNKEEKISAPKTKKGTIVCGVVSASEEYNKQLKSLDRKVLAIETESGGVFARAERTGIPAITVRGISDYADGVKGQLEDTTAGFVRELAARNAASFLKLQFENPNFVKNLKTNSLGNYGQADLFSKTDQKITLPKLVEQISERIESRLNDLSPEYKLLPKGFVLPIPRVKRSGARISKSEVHNAVEIRDCLKSQRNLYLSLSRGYPEKSLAWLIADELIQWELNDKKIIPIVVDGDQIKPPSHSIEFVAGNNISNFGKDLPIQPVIIFDGVPLHSKSKMDFIVRQLDYHKDAKFIFVDRTSSNLFFEGEFEVSLAADPYEVCEISFSQMSHFVQKNFEMGSSEADVIALRLRNTFNKFDLSAHPTYFAGIPRNTLSALIQVNRRAELMELAVVGFMTFVVADDKSGTQLSRTTRTRFVQKLLVSIWVEKRTYNNAELISFTTDFAKEFDFDIEPIAFIKDFLDKGIMHFENDRIVVSLPFIEHYLLASALAADENLALSYFNVDDESFDYATFDLYSEIGPSDELVNIVTSKLEASIDELHNGESQEPFLWSPKLDSDLKISQRKVDSLQQRVEDAMKSVREDEDVTHEKQQILDASDHVRSSIVERQKEEMEESPGNFPVPLDEVGNLAQLWTIGTYLLGSGAEHLNAKTKRKLVSLELKAATILIDDWVKLQNSIDFDGLKKELTSDENMKEFLKDSPSDRSEEDVKKLFTDLVESIQFMLLAMPIHKVLSFVCEHARDGVLSPSISQTIPLGRFEKFIKAIWLSEIDVSKGKQLVVDAMKELPNARFFRICIATHFLTRVYWAHAKKRDRLEMLEHADAILKPTSISIGKPELKRMIEKETKKAKNA